MANCTVHGWDPNGSRSTIVCDETHDVMMVVDGGGGSNGVFYKFIFSIPLP